MDTKTDTSSSFPPTDQRLAVALENLSKARSQVERTRHWYDRHARRPMILFRVFGVLVILMSVSVPFLGTLEGLWKTTVLPIVTLAIAGLTGLNAFFQWQSQWQGFRQTQFTLEFLLSKWDLAILEAKLQTDTNKAVETVVRATAVLLDQAREATASETGQFFKGIHLTTAKPAASVADKNS